MIDLLSEINGAVNSIETRLDPNVIANEVARVLLQPGSRQLVTKEDLQDFATKKDLQDFATKEDLQDFATKKDLQDFATKKDLQDLKNAFDELVYGVAKSALANHNSFRYELHLERIRHYNQARIFPENLIRVPRLRDGRIAPIGCGVPATRRDFLSLQGDKAKKRISFMILIVTL